VDSKGTSVYAWLALNAGAIVVATLMGRDDVAWLFAGFAGFAVVGAIVITFWSSWTDRLRRRRSHPKK
jgi:hypothetical protein